MNTENQEVTPDLEISPVTQEDGVIKINLGELNKQSKDAVQEQSTNEVSVLAESESSGALQEENNEETVVELAREESPVENQEDVLEEITDEEVQEIVATVKEDIAEAIEAQSNGVPLPDNIQKVVDFINETGGSLEDYVKLNTDYASLNEDQLLKEYYQATRPDLDSEEIDFLLEDKFQWEDEYDDDKDIKRKKLARKEELLKAKKHLEGLKSRYYEEIKAGSKLNPEQQKAVEFFNRYTKENEEDLKVGEKQKSIFTSKTQEVFSDQFKGFEYSVGEKRYRFNVKNVDEVKNTQSDLNNFVKKFLNDKNEMSDAKGYHKSLFTAMNPDAVANHFYEQGKADAIRESITKAKNVDVDPRGVHEQVTNSNGWTVRSVNGVDASEFKLKIKNNRI
jgi:hypothetical protein